PDTQQLQKQRKAFLRELDAMIRLRSPHTVNVYGAITSLPNRLVLVMEFLAGGDLRSMLKRAEHPLPEAQCRQIMGDICAGMAFLHSKATVHGDLKSANILLDGRGRAKIGDFGTFFQMGSEHRELDRPGDVHHEGGKRHRHQLRMDCPRGELI
ncbi:unnamed protein product, partial [Ectocarpus sp. 8 AP-2014]